MKITESEYQKLCPLLVTISRAHGHPRDIDLDELEDLLRASGIQADLEEAFIDFFLVFWRKLPDDGESALQRILERLEQEVFDCTGRYPKRPDFNMPSM